MSCGPLMLFSEELTKGPKCYAVPDNRHNSKA